MCVRTLSNHWSHNNHALIKLQYINHAYIYIYIHICHTLSYVTAWGLTLDSFCFELWIRIYRQLVGFIIKIDPLVHSLGCHNAVRAWLIWFDDHQEILGCWPASFWWAHGFLSWETLVQGPNQQRIPQWLTAQTIPQQLPAPMDHIRLPAQTIPQRLPAPMDHIQTPWLR